MRMDKMTFTDDSGTREVRMQSYPDVGPQSIRVQRVDPSKRRYKPGRPLSIVDTDLKPSDTAKLAEIINSGNGELKWKGHFLRNTSGHVIVQNDVVILSVHSRENSLQCSIPLADVRKGLEQE